MASGARSRSGSVAVSLSGGRHTTASVWRRGRGATGAELLFLRGYEGEAGKMRASTSVGKGKPRAPRDTRGC